MAKPVEKTYYWLIEKSLDKGIHWSCYDNLGVYTTRIARERLKEYRKAYGPDRLFRLAKYRRIMEIY